MALDTSTIRIVCHRCVRLAEIRFIEFVPWGDAMIACVVCHDEVAVVSVEGIDIQRQRGKADGITFVLQDMRHMDHADIQERYEQNERAASDHADKAAFYSRVLQGTI